MLPIAAAVFDLDGTLVDSIDDITTHMNDALATRGLRTHAREVVVQWVGRGAAHLVQCAVTDPALVPEVLAEFRDRYRARPVIDARLYAGLDAALDRIASRCKLAVLSNKPHEPTSAIARELLARWPFALVVGQRADRPCKPDAASLLAVLHELGCPPDHSVMIGDSEIDIATARNAGLRSIGVAWGFRGADALRDADVVVHTPGELAALFA